MDLGTRIFMMAMISADKIILDHNYHENLRSPTAPQAVS